MIIENALKYKDYTGSIEASLEDRLLHGRVLFIVDTVSYEGSNFDELENSFHEAIDEYIAHCVRIGKNPNKPMSGSFNVRIGQELHRKAAIRAAMEKVSLNDLVKRSVEHYLLTEEVTPIHA